jgi:hypothetical protein
MAREEFIDNLRRASQAMAPPNVDMHGYGLGPRSDVYLRGMADLWLTTKSVEGFDADDFADWPEDVRATLKAEVTAFNAIVEKIPADKPPTKAQLRQARKHLGLAMDIVRDQLLPEWIAAQNQMIDVATGTAKAKGWYVDKDEKEVLESLLGRYKAPRLRIRTVDNEVVLDPIARFGSGQQGVVDLVRMPTFETAYLIAFKDKHWQIVSLGRASHRRPFTQLTLANTINKLSSSH